MPEAHTPTPNAGLCRVIAASLFLALLSAIACADDFSLFPPSVPASHFFPPAPRGDRALGVASLLPAGAWSRGYPDRIEVPSFRTDGGEPTSPSPSDRPPRLFTSATTWTTAGVLVAVTAWAGLGVQKDDYTPFMFTGEKFFGKDTYAGGADKCSHFILSATLARELGWAYEKEGHPRGQSLLLSLGVTVVAGVVQEIGDAFTPYGYAWEDIVADTLGGVSGAALSYYELNDLIGLRFGFIPNNAPANSCCEESLGENYSQEIYSGDLKLAGLAKRLKINLGPARFLLVSATYDTKAYGFVPARPDRQRNVGIDVGLNLPEILSAAGVPETTWWGTVLYKVFNVFRIPYTAFGFRYDMNHRHWRGPDTGTRFR